MGILRLDTGTLVIEGDLEVDSPVLSYEETILADSPVGYWRFEEGSGTSVADTSGGGAPLTIDSTAWGAAIVGSGAGDFDGVDFAQTTGGSSPVLDGSTAFSMECWFNISATTGLDYVVSLPDGGVNNGADIGVNGTTLDFRVHTQNQASQVSSSGTYVFGQDTHAVLTYDGAFIRGYINGVATTPAAQTGGLDHGATTHDVFVARFSGSFAAQVIGRIDEVALYNSVLSQAQVSAHFAAK